MATSRQNNEWSEPATVKETSIAAHIVKSIAVTMSISEINQLIESFGVHYENLTPIQRRIHAEFVQSVESLR